MRRISLLERAHFFIGAKLSAGDIAIDATVGNGHDTAFLLAQVQASGRVYGFDIQQDALTATLATTHNPQNLQLFCACHSRMKTFIADDDHGRIKACMFNLGYLPGGDKSLITGVDTSLTALASALEILAADGLITVLAYPGHPGGGVETDAVATWCHALAKRNYRLTTLRCDFDNPLAPRLFVIEALIC